MGWALLWEMSLHFSAFTCYWLYPGGDGRNAQVLFLFIKDIVIRGSIGKTQHCYGAKQFLISNFIVIKEEISEKTTRTKEEVRVSGTLTSFIFHSPPPLQLVNCFGAKPVYGL